MRENLECKVYKRFMDDEFAKKSWYGRIFEPKIVKSYARIEMKQEEKGKKWFISLSTDKW